MAQGLVLALLKAALLVYIAYISNIHLSKLQLIEQTLLFYIYVPCILGISELTHIVLVCLLKARLFD